MPDCASSGTRYGTSPPSSLSQSVSRTESAHVTSVPSSEPTTATSVFFETPATSRSITTVSATTVTKAAPIGLTPRSSSGSSSFQIMIPLAASEISAPQPTIPP